MQGFHLEDEEAKEEETKEEETSEGGEESKE